MKKLTNFKQFIIEYNNNNNNKLLVLFRTEKKT